MKVYGVQVVEDNELYVKDFIDGNFPTIKATIPVSNEIEEIDGRKVMIFSRTLEGYILLQTKDDFSKYEKQLIRIDGVSSLLNKANSPMPEEEAKPFMCGLSKDVVALLKKGLVNVIGGQHAGRRGKVVSCKLPILKIALVSATNKKSAGTVLVSVWDIVKILDQEDK